MSYHHFTIDKREKIYLLHNQGLPMQNIVLKLGRNPSSVSRELHRIKAKRKKIMKIDVKRAIIR